MRSPISSGIIESQKSYWATHLCSLLECIHYHVNIQHSPRKLPQFPKWSLSDMRGNFPQNFFHHIKGWIYNWGFQYFLAHFLNQRGGRNAVGVLLDSLSNEFNVNFSSELNKYWFYMAGWDTYLSIKLKGRFDKIFPEKAGLLPPNVDEVIDGADLCLVLVNERENINVGIFGEVEGNKGRKLFSPSFWADKSDYCVFSFGVVKGRSKECYAETYYCNGAPKINIIFEADNFVVNDFYIAVNKLEALFQAGPGYYVAERDEELEFFMNYLIKNWNTPMIEVLNFLYKFIDHNDYIGKVDGSLPFMTSIQAERT